MNEQAKHQIKKFVTDPAMSHAVFSSMYDFFGKLRKTDDVQMLAAERLALFFLEDVIKDLKRYGVEEKEKDELTNIGL